MVVLELGLHQSYVDTFCREAEPAFPKSGFAPTGRQGVHEAILKSNPLNRNGKQLGFEPLVFDYSLSCSWLCNSLDTTVHDALGIRPNTHGLIEDFNAACRCVDFIARPDVGAEPGLWLPWLLIDHTGQVQQSAQSDS